MTPSIKNAKHKLCGAVPQIFINTGSDQTQQQNGAELLKMGSFKHKFAHSYGGMEETPVWTNHWKQTIYILHMVIHACRLRTSMDSCK